MTYDECTNELEQMDSRVYLLALVAQIHAACIEACEPEDQEIVAWALDTTRRWCLGFAQKEECTAAGDAVSSASLAAACAGDEAADKATQAASIAVQCTDNTVHSVAFRALYAAHCAFEVERGANDDSAMTALVLSVRDVRWEEAVITARGCVVTPTHTWLREGGLGGRWLTRAEVTPEDWVRLDEELEVTERS